MSCYNRSILFKLLWSQQVQGANNVYASKGVDVDSETLFYQLNFIIDSQPEICMPFFDSRSMKYLRNR
jgi:hypothetical protein